ncbi:MAG TPA: hypothetical protein ENG51_06175 [Deltaproteobacteria bacterium]|nr:hypothetical protein [Deltaproteobacteria bacterium]
MKRAIGLVLLLFLVTSMILGQFIDTTVVDNNARGEDAYPPPPPPVGARVAIGLLIVIVFYFIIDIWFGARLGRSVENDIKPTKILLRCFSLLPLGLAIAVILIFIPSAVPDGVYVGYPFGMLSYMFGNFLIVFTVVVLVLVSVVMFVVGR